MPCLCQDNKVTSDTVMNFLIGVPLELTMSERLNRIPGIEAVVLCWVPVRCRTMLVLCPCCGGVVLALCWCCHSAVLVL